MGDSSEKRAMDEEAVELTGKIMVVGVIILFMVVLFVLLLHLYAKWFWGRVEEASSAVATAPSPPRRRRSRRFVFAPGQDPTVAVRTGLDPMVLKSLPVVVFKPQEFKEGLECAVCLSDVVEGEKARVLKDCNHGFHVDCIDMWFQSHSTCPLCRKWVGPSKPIDFADDLEESGGDTNSEAEENMSGVVQPTESPNFPTNVLFWGNEMQVSSGNTCLEEVASSSSTVSAQPSARPGMVVIDIQPPRPASDNLSPDTNLSGSSSSSSSSSSRVGEEELKSTPVPTRLRSLKRLLSRERRVSPCLARFVDVELIGRNQPC